MPSQNKTKPGTKKKQRHRTIKNPIVDIDDVTIGPGVSFSNWTPIARRKLKKRELALLQDRREICNDIIIDRVHKFIDENPETFNIQNDRIKDEILKIYKQQIKHKLIDLNSDIMCECSRFINNELSEWKGYTTRSKEDVEIKTFRHYFQCSRRWFDSKKIDILAIAFWIPIIRLIDQFAQLAAAHIFSNGSFDIQKAYRNYFSVSLSIGVFEGHMKPSNARLMFIVPATAYSTIIKQSNPSIKHIRGKNKENRVRYLQSLYHKLRGLRRSFESELSSSAIYNKEQNNINSTLCSDNSCNWINPVQGMNWPSLYPQTETIEMDNNVFTGNNDWMFEQNANNNNNNKVMYPCCTAPPIPMLPIGDSQYCCDCGNPFCDNDSMQYNNNYVVSSAYTNTGSVPIAYPNFFKY